MIIEKLTVTDFPILGDEVFNFSLTKDSQHSRIELVEGGSVSPVITYYYGKSCSPSYRAAVDRLFALVANLHVSNFSANEEYEFFFGTEDPIACSLEIDFRKDRKSELYRYNVVFMGGKIYDQQLRMSKGSRFVTIDEATSTQQKSILSDEYYGPVILFNNDMYLEQTGDESVFTNSRYYELVNLTTIQSIAPVLRELQDKALFEDYMASFFGTFGIKDPFSKKRFQRVVVLGKDRSDNTLELEIYLETSQGRTSLSSVAHKDIKTFKKILFMLGLALCSFDCSIFMIATNIDDYLNVNELRKIYYLITSRRNTTELGSQFIFSLNDKSNCLVLQHPSLPKTKFKGDLKNLMAAALE